MSWVWIAVGAAGYLGALVGFVLGWCCRVAMERGSEAIGNRQSQIENEHLGIGA